MKQETIIVKLTALETSHQELKEEVRRNSDLIETLNGKLNNLIGNHISELQQDISGLKAQNKFVWGILTLIFAGILSLFFK